MHVYLTNLCGSAKERLPIYTKEGVEVRIYKITSNLTVCCSILFLQSWSQPEEENNWSSNIWSKMEWWNGDKVGPIHQTDEIALMRRLDVSFLRPEVDEEPKTK